jgi:hypothetical protein
MVRDVLRDDVDVDVVCSIATKRWERRGTAQSQQVWRRRIGNTKEGAIVNRTDGNSTTWLGGGYPHAEPPLTSYALQKDDVGCQVLETSQ